MSSTQRRGERRGTRRKNLDEIFRNAKGRRIREYCTRPSAPTGLWPPAQGCEARATLGNEIETLANPNGVVSFGVATAPVGLTGA